MGEWLTYSAYVKVLFVCSRNRRRSPTAEVLFSSLPGIEVASAGASPDAENVVSADLIEWAEVIFAMESVHKRKLRQRYGHLLRTRRVIVLDIQDDYKYMDKRLIALLNDAVTPYLGLEKLPELYKRTES
jgi:predicted protein tyrosine phosphatase